MKRYLVKCTGIAKDTNLIFANMKSFAYYGKREKCVAHLGDFARMAHSEKQLSESNLVEYGYKRKCDAQHSSILKLPKETKFWIYDYEIVEYEVAER